jgi:hypothetical protein
MFEFESSFTWDLNLSSPMLNLRVHNWEFEFTHVWIWEFIHVGFELEFTHVWIWESTDIEWIHVSAIVFYEHMFDQVFNFHPIFFSLITCKKLYLWQFLFLWAA